MNKYLITQGFGGPPGLLLRKGFWLTGSSLPPTDGSVVTQGFGGPAGLFLRKGYWITPKSTATDGSVITQGLGGPGGLVLRQGFAFSLSDTFLAALVSAIRGSSELAVWIGRPARIYTSWPGAKVPLPFVKIEDYVEEQPGEALEHSQNRLTFGVYGRSLTQVRLCGEAIQNFIDDPNQNNQSMRPPLAWVDGIEQGCKRQPTLPPKRLPQLMYGVDFYGWQLDYEFDYVPEFQF